MKECKYCRSMYDDNLSVCPNCGGSKVVTAEEKAEEATLYQKEIENRERAIVAPELQKKKLLGIVAGIVGIIVFIIAIASYNANKPMSNGMTKDEGEAVLVEGISYYESGDYEAAIECFVQLPIDSEQYEEAQEMIKKSSDSYRDNLFSKVDTYVQNNEYEVAIGMLEKASVILPNDREITNKLNKYKKVYIDFLHDKTVSEVKKFAEEENFASAIKTIKSVDNELKNDEELTSLLELYEDEFCNQLLKNAELAYETDGYEAAINILNDGLNLVDEPLIKDKISYYEDKKPILLYNIDYFDQSENGALALLHTAIDNLGNAQTNVLIGSNTSNWIWKSSCRTTYKLNGKYKKISGTLFLSYDFRSSAYEPYVSIWCDDVLVAQYTVGSGIEPIDFEVDLTGVDELEVYVEDTEAGIGFDCYGGIANLYLWK